MRELPGPQDSDRWFQHRLGRITGSRISDLLTQPRSKADREAGKESQTRYKYRFYLTGERVTGMLLKNRPETPSMAWGSMMEKHARPAFELATGKMLIETGFVLHPTQDFSGSSPDSIVSGGGIYEGKAPDTDTHLRYLDEKVVPEEYWPQFQWEIACCEQTHGFFHSYDPRIKGAGQNFIIAADRDSEWIAKLEAEAAKMDAEIEAWLAENGFPPTIWNTKGDEVVITPTAEQQWPADLTSSEYDFVDGQEMVP